MKFLIRPLFAVAATILCATHAADFTGSSTDELIGVDRRRERRSGPTAEQVQGREKLREQVGRAKVDFDSQHGSAKWIRAEQGALSGPGGEGRAIPVKAAQRFQNDPHKPVKAFVEEHRALLGHGVEELEAATRTRDYVSRETGVRTSVWQQRVDDIPVYESIFSAHVSRLGELIDVSSQFVPGVARAANRGTPNRAQQLKAPKTSARRAIDIALATIRETAENVTSTSEKPEGAEQLQTFRIKPLPGEATARLVWFPLDRDTLRLAWQIELQRRQLAERFRVLVDVQNGDVLLWRKLTVEIGAVSYRVFTNDSPTYMRPGWPTPNAAQPAIVPQSLVTIDAVSTNASPLGWINDGEVLLRGNNIDAALDRDADNRADLPRLTAAIDGAGNRVFDYPVAPTLSPTNYSAGATVQLFYWCNFAHDRLYDIGFTEEKGNYQKDNFGRGGAGNDPVLAQAQDGSGVNNANFTPSPDGQPGLIQMYVFNSSTPNRDGALDAEVVLHEYTHGMSDRRVGHGTQISQLQTWGMAEGWSDFFAEALLTRYEHDLDANYPMGGYASYLLGGLQESYYYGIRRYPYTTATNINPLRFSDIDSLQASVYPGIPRSPIATGSAAEVHRIGEVWCTMLWEVRAALLKQMSLTPETYAAANDFVMKVVADGMDFVPPNPTFVQARDGILTAERQLTGGTNATTIWRAFAKRGLGYSAVSLDSSTTVGIVAAHDLPPPATFVVWPPTLEFTGIVGGTMEPKSADFVLTNAGDSDLVWSLATDGPFAIAPRNGVVPGHGSIAVTVTSDGLSALPIGQHIYNVLFTNIANALGAMGTVVVNVDPPEDTLSVEPASTFLSSGQIGGPFDPDARIYTLQASAPLAWSISNIPPWLTFSQTNGSLEAGQVTNVTATINTLATALTGGVYSVTVYMVNHTTGTNFPCAVALRIATDDYITEDFTGRPFDLQNSLLTLTPSGSAYVACLGPATELPTNPTNGTTLAGMADDEYRMITLEDGKTVTLFGQTTNVLWVGANGNITPNPGANTNFFYPGTFEYFAALRVAPLYVDLNPQQGGRISWQQLSNRVVVSYENVPEFGRTNANTFQIELYFDGGIRIAWLNIETEGAIAGISRGAGLPPNFLQSDLSALSGCTLSARLAIPLLAREGDAPITGTILLSAPAASNLTVALAVNSPEISVPSLLTVPEGTMSYPFPITVNDDTLLDGSQPATITANFADRPPAAATIVVNDNETTRLIIAVPAEVTEGSGVLADQGLILLGAPAGRDVTVHLSSSNVSRIVVPESVVVPAGSEIALFDITVLDDKILNGAMEDVAVSASVAGWPLDRDLITVRDDDPYELKVVVVPQVSEAANTVINGSYVALSAVSTVDVSVSLTSDRSSTLFPEPTVLIPAGTRSNSFSLFVVNNTNVNTFDSAQIVAASPGFLSATGTVQVLDDERPTKPFGASPTNGSVLVPSQPTLSWTVNPIPAPGTIQFWVYLSTNAATLSNSLVGITTNLSFTPAIQLESGQQYFWRVVARRDPFGVESAVWTFTTAPVDRFTVDTIASPQAVGVPFDVTVRARDRYGSLVPSYRGAVTLGSVAPTNSRARVVITEIDTENLDRVEFQNVSDQPINVSGWQICLYDTQTWPAPKTIFSVPSPSVAQPGQTFRLLAFASQLGPGTFPNFIVGTSLLWNNNLTNNPIAVLLRDTSGQVVDVFCAVDAVPAAITNPAVIPGSEWQGAPVPVNLTAGMSYQRVGNRDRNTAEDWTYKPTGILATNEGLVVPFTNYISPRLIAPVLTNFQNGSCSASVTVLDEAFQLYLTATDEGGRLGGSARFDVLAFEDISVRASAPDAVVVEESFTVAVVVTNRGANTAVDVMLTNYLAPGVSLVSAESSQGACTVLGDAVVCALGALPGDSSAVLSLRIKVSSPVTVTNVITVSRADADSYPANNSVTTMTTAGLPQLMVLDGTVMEPFVNPATINFNVRLTRSNAATVTVNFTTSDGLATSGIDYLPTNGTLTFPPGVTNQTISVVVLPDALSESNETFFINLSGAVNAQIVDGLGVGTINDSDSNPVLNVSDIVVPEGSDGTNVATFSLTLSAVSGKQVSVSYATMDASAIAGFDYLPAYGTVSFPPGVTNRVVNVPILSSPLFKAQRVFALALSAPFQVSLAKFQATCTIVDKDTNRIDHLAFDLVPSHAFVDVPFNIGGSARDSGGALVTNFAGPVYFLAADNELTRTAGTNGAPWEFPCGAGFHDSRLQAIYVGTDIGAAGHITSLALDVTNAPGMTLSNFTIRTKQFGSVFPTISWESTGWTTNFQANVTITATGWQTFAFQTPCRFDGPATNLLVDFSFNNSAYGAEGLCRSSVVPGLRSLGFRTDSAFGDPLTWSNNVPSPSWFNRVPNARFTIGQPIAVAPAKIQTATNGTFGGAITLGSFGTNITFRATDGEGHFAVYSGFQVLLDGDGDGVPDWWELANGLDRANAADGALDPDGDGLSNLDEYIGGTDPHDAASFIKIVSVSRPLPDRVLIRVQSVVGRQYQLETTTNLPPSWTAVNPPLQGTGTELQLLHRTPQDDACRYYRVRVSPADSVP